MFLYVAVFSAKAEPLNKSFNNKKISPQNDTNSDQDVYK